MVAELGAIPLKRGHVYIVYKALRVVGGSARYARSLALTRKNGTEQEQMVQHFRCKQATCKFQELHAPGKQPGTRMHVYMHMLF